MITITNLIVGLVTPGDPWTQLEAADMAFVPRRLTIFLTAPEAEKFKTDQPITLTLADAAETTTALPISSAPVTGRRSKDKRTARKPATRTRAKSYATSQRKGRR